MRFWLFLILLFIYIQLVLLLISCAEPMRQFNTEDEQDQVCMGKYGYSIGYCSKATSR